MLILTMAALLVGVAPAVADSDDYDFELTEMYSDEVLTLADLTNGMPLVVHVWGPDCPHCRVHMPYAMALYDKLDLDKVNYMLLSVTGSTDEVREFLEERELDLPVLIGDSGEYGDGYLEEGWPTTYVFAPGGELVGWCDILGPAYITTMQDLIDQAIDSGFADSTLGLDKLRNRSHSRSE
ncbi:TlpA family protein disulfide reductase [bacterium]|nr:TlpA family protein disulfide reductase [bacterium]